MAEVALNVVGSSHLPFHQKYPVLGPDVTELILTVQRGETIRGAIVPLDVWQELAVASPWILLAPTAKSDVSSFDRMGLRSLMIRPEADGTFKMSGVAAGAYRAQLHFNTGKSRTQKRTLPGLLTIDSKSKAKIALDLASVRIGELKGRVMLEGKPHGDVTVMLSCLGTVGPFAGTGSTENRLTWDSSLMFVKTDSEGRFSVARAIAGRYGLQKTPSATPESVRDFSPGGGELVFEAKR